ncbi:MAG TPA: type II toxin-antitoxin system RelE/ParE family toxin [Magnetococcales bacterium]|nr:type II toxin-antitoxin system RelE/ParE family toxin [Magnetococcales bacterium]
MHWTVDIGDVAERQLLKLDSVARTRILDYLTERIDGCENPRRFGTALKGDKTGWWRYRVGDYRLLCDVDDARVVVFVIAIGHRREVYRS